MHGRRRAAADVDELTLGLHVQAASLATPCCAPLRQPARHRAAGTVRRAGGRRALSQRAVRLLAVAEPTLFAEHVRADTDALDRAPAAGSDDAEAAEVLRSTRAASAAARVATATDAIAAFVAAAGPVVNGGQRPDGLRGAKGCSAPVARLR